MKYLSWDIGIKNLAYCIIDNSNNIKELKIINLIDEPIIHKCICYNKNGNMCKSKALYINKLDDSIKYCNKHYNALTLKDQKRVKKIKPPKKCSKYTLEELGTNLFSALAIIALPCGKR